MSRLLLDVNKPIKIGDVSCKPCFKDVGSTSDLASLISMPITQLEDILLNPLLHYSSFKRRKKKGGYRQITAPKKYLRNAQRILKKYIEKNLTWPSYVHGGIKNRSTITNAQDHVSQQLLFNLDIKDFFPSVSSLYVQDLFVSLGANPQVAKVLANFCCHTSVVPQGAPTSSLLTNLAFAPVDTKIINIVRRAPKIKYTRYVDDISLSGDEGLGSFKGHVEAVIERSGFKMSLSQITRRDKQQIVTGLIVNDKLRPTNDFINDLEDDIKLCLDRSVGPSLVADLYDISGAKLKGNLYGRIQHLSKFRSKNADKIMVAAKKIKWQFN